MTLRSDETQIKYEQYLLNKPKDNCPFCELKRDIIKEYNYWIIMENKFPLDEFWVVSHILAPKEHVKEFHLLSGIAQMEFKKIKKYLNNNKYYDHIMEDLPRNRTIPKHFHYHLLKLYE